MLTLRDELQSKEDATIKYVFESKGNILEFSLIRKGDGKDIICVPIQTSCNLGCKFCFLTGSGLPVRSLSVDEIIDGIDLIAMRAKLPTNPTLLVSFMGSGEPLNNWQTVIETCKSPTSYQNQHGYKTVRFGLATIIPRVTQFNDFADRVAAEKLPIKVHFSLHSPFDAVRFHLLPAAERVRPSMMALERYTKVTGNPIELHYTLIDGKNDHDIDMSSLAILVNDHGKPPVKFLAFRERPDLDLKRSKRTSELRKILESYGVVVEEYSPPGNDIGASCGQFTMKKYTEEQKPSLTESAREFLKLIGPLPKADIGDLLSAGQNILDGRGDYEVMEPYPEPSKR